MSCNLTIGNVSLQMDYALGAIMIATTLIGSLGNIFLLVVLYENKELHTPSYKILRSLVYANLFTSLLVAPLHVIQYFDVKGIVDKCKVDLVRRGFSAIFLSASFFTVGFMAFNTCLRLIYLGKYKMPEKLLYTVIGLCWTVPFILPIVFLGSHREIVYSVLVVIFGTIIEVIFVTSFVGVLVALKIHTRRSSNKTLAAHREKILGTTVFITIIYSMTMVTPLVLYHYLSYFNKYDKQSLTLVYNIALTLAISNSAVNPLIHLKRDREVKRTLRNNFQMEKKIHKATSEFRKSIRAQSEFLIMDRSRSDAADIKSLRLHSALSVIGSKEKLCI